MKTISIIIANFILTFLMLSTAYAWTPDFATAEGTLEYVNSLVNRHPKMPTANIQYRLNPFKAFGPVPELLQSLGENAIDINVSETQLIGLRFQAVPVNYDQEKIQRIIAELKSRTNDLPIPVFQGFKRDFEALQSVEEAGKNLKSVTRDWMLVAPLIYTASGEVLSDNASMNRSELVHRIESLTATDMINAYEDFYSEHLIELVHTQIDNESKKRFTEGIYNSVKSDFIAKKLSLAVTPVAPEGVKLQSRTISLEKVGVASILRGFTSGDCSGLSVPYYPLVKGAQVFWIRKDMNPKSDPVGYAFVIEVIVNGQKTPYVLTINGSTLSQSDTKSIIKLVGQIYETRNVILPNFNIGTNKYLVNYEENRSGMIVGNSQEVTVQLPQGWTVVENYINNRPVTGGYGNYYASERIKKAYLVHQDQISVNVVSPLKSRPFLPYEQVTNIQSHPLLERAVLANNALTRDQAKKLTLDRQKILSILGITEEQLLTASPLINANKDNPITLRQFKALEKTFDFKFGQLQRLDIITRAYSLNKLYSEDPTLASKEDWEKAVQSNIRYLRSNLGDFQQALQIQNGQAVQEYFKAKSQLTFLKINQDYWDYEIDALKNNNEETIKAVLTSLPKGSRPPDEIWAALFEKARTSSGSLRQKIFLAISNLDQTSPHFSEFSIHLLESKNIGVQWGNWAFRNLMSASPTEAQRKQAVAASRRIFTESAWGHNNGISTFSSDVPNNTGLLEAVINSMPIEEGLKFAAEQFKSAFNAQVESWDKERNSFIKFIINNYFGKMTDKDKQEVCLLVLEKPKAGVLWGNWAFRNLMSASPTEAQRKQAVAASHRIFAESSWGHNNGISAFSSDVSNNTGLLEAVMNSMTSKDERVAYRNEILSFAESSQNKSYDSDRALFINRTRSLVIGLSCKDVFSGP